MIINTPHQIFDQQQAAELAARLNSDDEDSWTYIAENNPNPDGPKTAIIKIYENDELIGRL